MEPQEYARMFEYETRHWWFAGTRRVVLDVLSRRLPPGPLRLLDVGCGTGGTTARLAGLGSVLGLERERAALGLARSRELAGAALAGADAAALPVRTGSVDAVVLLDVLEHVDDESAVLGEVRRVLAPGGLALVTVPALQALWSEHDEALHHRRRYSRAALQQSLEVSGLTVQYLTYYNSFLFPAVAAARLLGRARRRLCRRAGSPRSDLSRPPPPVNAALAGLLGAERHLLRHLRLPIGVSLLAVAGAPRPR